MPAATTNNMGQVLKKLWPQKVVEVLTYEDSPRLAMLKKKVGWRGDKQEIVIGHTMGGGVSNDYETANATRSPSGYGVMEIDTAEIYAVWSVAHKLMRKGADATGSVAKPMESETKNAILRVKRRLSYQVWGNGGGSCARMIATQNLNTNIITLTDYRHAKRIEPGDTLVFAADDGNPVKTQLGVKAGDVKVTNVDVEDDIAYITVDENLADAVPLVAVSDYVFPKGDYGNAVRGYLSYIVPYSSPEAIWGMPRNVHRRRQAGVLVGGKNLMEEQAIKRAMSRMAQDSQSVNRIFLHTDRFYNLEMSLEGRRQYVDIKVGEAQVGFTGIKFTSANGKPVEAFADPDIEYDYIAGETSEDWVLHSTDPVPDFFTANGNKYEMEPTALALKGQAGAYLQQYPENPGKHFILDMTL